MSLKNPKFKCYTLDEDKVKSKHTVISIKLNVEEYAELQQLKRLLFQSKKSIVIKNAVSIALAYIKSNTNMIMLDIQSNNQRRETKNLRNDLEIKRYSQENK